MIFINKTNVNMKIDIRTVHPNESYDYMNHVFDTIDIHSDIGSAKITCEYVDRYITTWGNLVINKEEDKFIISEKN